jgi:hypothetical protein
MSCDDFQGEEKITVKPGDNLVPYTFKVTTESAAGKEDGFLPFGSSIAGVTVKALDQAKADQTSSLIVGTPSLAIDTIQVNVKWPGKADVYNLEFVLDLGGGIARELDFLRVESVE